MLANYNQNEPKYDLYLATDMELAIKYYIYDWFQKFRMRGKTNALYALKKRNNKIKNYLEMLSYLTGLAPNRHQQCSSFLLIIIIGAHSQNY